MRKPTFPASRPLFYYITDRRQLSPPSVRCLMSRVRCAVAWGVDFIQLREKDLPDRELLDLTRRAVEAVRGTCCRILVNGRCDVALAGGAHGVHLPSSDLKAADLRPFLPEGFLIGASSHSLREARRAATDGADYLLLGPVFPTPSKVGYGEPLGLSRFARISSALPILIFGLGGIDPGQIASVIHAGAMGIAGIRLFQEDLGRFSRRDFRISGDEWYVTAER